MSKQEEQIERVARAIFTMDDPAYIPQNLEHYWGQLDEDTKHLFMLRAEAAIKAMGEGHE